MTMASLNTLGVDQFLHENQTWERALDFYLQENAFLKTRLSQVLDSNTDKAFIPLAEHFQTSFIQMDECMQDLKQDILSSQKLLKEKTKGGALDEKLLSSKHQKLNNEMGYFEKNFAGLKNEFNRSMIRSQGSSST